MAVKLECDRCKSQELLTPPVMHDNNKDKMRPNLIVKHPNAMDIELWLCNRCKTEIVSEIKDFSKGASA